MGGEDRGVTIVDDAVVVEVAAAPAGVRLLAVYSAAERLPSGEPPMGTPSGKGRPAVA